MAVNNKKINMRNIRGPYEYTYPQGGTRVMLVYAWAVHGATELWVFTMVAFCAARNGSGFVSYG